MKRHAPQALFAAALLAIGWRAWAAGAGDWTVLVDHVQRSGSDVAASAPAPEGFPEGRWFVLKAPKGPAVPAQIERVQGKRILRFILPQVAADASLAFAVQPGRVPRRNSPNPRGVRITVQSGDATVRIDGRLFTVWRARSGTKPICYPVLGPHGLPMTRNWPMKNVPGERHDHRHHRSFWFAHGNVNGVDFWTERPGRTGSIVQRSIETTDGPVFGVIRAACDWIAPNGRRVCTDQRTMRIYAVRNGRMFDYTVRVTASDGPVNVGDTKEGTLAFRTAASMKPDARKGGVVLLANGARNRAAWGRRARWLDAWGPVQGRIVGIAMLEHPDSFRAPTWWHARTYGLIAANPFGWSYFMHDKSKNGACRLAKGKSLIFRFRIWLHEGDANSARVDDAWWNYAHPPRVRIVRQRPD